MKPEKFAALKGPDGKPVVTIMGDPDVSVVSLVPRGANGRQFGVAKADLGAGEGPELNGGAMGVTPAEVGMIRRFLSFFSGGTVTDTTAKSEDEPAKSFAEALAPQVFWSKWWDVSSALRESVESVMEDPMLTDKPAEIRKRFADAANYLVSQLPAANPLGLEMVAKAHREADDGAAVFVAKAGKVLSTKNKAAVASAIAALQAVLDAADSSTTAAKAADNQEDEPMKLDQNAINAAVTAGVIAYKAANPGATDAQIQSIAAKSAAEIAAKASMTPDQPARPAGQLDGEIADAGAGLQAAGLQAMIDRAMAPLMATVAKQAERIAELESVLSGAPVVDDKGVVAKSADGAEIRTPGLIDTLVNVGKSIEGIAGRVSAMERAVPAGNAGRIENNRSTAAKADDATAAALRAVLSGGAQ